MNQRALHVIIGVLAIGLVVMSLAGLSGRRDDLARPASAQAQPSTPTRGITVVGEGKVTTQPDIAVLQLGVQTNRQTAQEALSESSRVMQPVIDAVKTLGVAETEIRTGRVSLNPVTAPPRRDDATGPTVVGYQATNQVTVTVSPEQAGQVLDAAVSAGANTSGGVRFGFRDVSKLQTQALQAAVENARTKADAMASSLGVKVDSVATAAEDSAMAPRPLGPNMADATREQAQPTPIQPGQQEITSRVTVTFTFR